MIYLKQHIEKYPSMQIEDKIKLIYQGTLGPNHISVNPKNLLINLENEYKESLKYDIDYSMIEEISDSYVRIYIKPYFDLYKSFDNLIKAFVLSCGIKIEYNLFINNLNEYLFNENPDIVASFLNNGYIHHSKQYKELYKPYYLVISKKYINILKGEDHEI